VPPLPAAPPPARSARPNRVRAPRTIAVASGAPIEVSGEGSGRRTGFGSPNGPGADRAPAEPAQTAEPLPAPPAAACSAPNVEARATSVVEPDAPSDDEAQGAGTEAKIRVDLSETGAVLAATVIGSTGNGRLDAAARMAALHSTYTPEIVDCKPRPGSYLFRVDFTG